MLTIGAFRSLRLVLCSPLLTLRHSTPQGIHLWREEEKSNLPGGENLKSADANRRLISLGAEK